ncbi:Hypothetical protein RG1141_CH01660 [Neorhizobium galegae bv. officinalis bv. officinalis str. HAMBI 1141]|uniref:Uncharacterized protein n=1 Tax=Neorhizobium galegae bv. officinalis bv. officinalis str. HAMBI 1141 TaxID=1028801 RepID=A0A068T3C3_NEOGA|nr:hypothetical protein [Neorhizobium galegae]CDN52531.1 Hypothetical protein RG1141_CH01660 [Neorhizobium galegae bv. officinalis bv. officinalis str. HAMBI 1141]
MITIVTPPSPIVTSSDLIGYGGDQNTAIAIIAAVTAEFDGPYGKLRRCFGPQTLDLTVPQQRNRPIRLPCPPIIEIVSVTSIDQSGDEAVIDEAGYKLKNGQLSWLDSADIARCNLVRIRYRAGYDGVKTGDLPAQIKAAIAMKANFLLRISGGAAFLRSEEVEGIGRTEYSIPEQATMAINSAADALVEGLKIYQL